MSRAAVMILATACVTAGCGPTLWQVSTPPPTRDVALDHEARAGTLHVARGVAVAFDCVEGFWWIDACRAATATSDNPEVARVLPAHLERETAQPAYGYQARPNLDRQRSGFVVVGASPGKTVVRVVSSKGTYELDVVVE